MNLYQPQEPDRSERYASGYLLYAVGGSVILAVILILVLALAHSSTPTSPTGGGGPSQVEESGVETARQSLARQTDLTTCRAALGQINSELSEKSQRRPPALTKEQNDWLRQHAGLDDDEIAEIDNSNYTQLDGQHLERCFLLRDVARGLEVKGVRGANGGQIVHEAGRDQAARAFDWVVRQVRLREHAGEAVPPLFVLRRGWGTPFERALVFLALLEQLGDPNAPRPELLGCLLYVPDDAGRERFWACGVVVGDGKDLYLFDPRLGLPLPGAKGEGIATLADVRKQPDILAALQVDKSRYDVTAEQARAARVRLVCPLSGLSPRMRYLQDELLAPALRVRLAADLREEQQRVQAACADKPTQVEVHKSALRLLRRFLPPEEGGVDRGTPVAPDDPRKVTRKDLFALDLVPWNSMPKQLLDPKRFPANIELGQRVRTFLARPFITSAQEPGHARDLLLRGRYSSAITQLVNEQEHWREAQKLRANAGDLTRQTNEWIEQAIRLYAAQLRAQPGPEREAATKQVQSLWSGQQSGPILILLNSAIAAARSPEITYLLGLCMQEQAEQVQARLDVQTRATGKAPSPLDANKARVAWVDARNTWKRYAEEYPSDADRASARRLRGRAEAMLGDWQAAVALWKDLSGEMTPLEKLASLYQAKQLEKQHSK